MVTEKMRNSLKLIALGLAGWLAVAAAGHSVSAANSPAPSGITVSPAFQMVSIPAGASQQPVTFTITNNQPVAQNLDFSVADFNTLNETGGLFFVGSNPTALQKKYGLAKWVSLPASSVTIPAKQTYKLQAEILNLPDLAAGGHYGALMISINNGSLAGSGNQVGLHPIASSLLFVTKISGATYNLSLADVSFKHSWLSLPKTVSLNFQNTGNTHVTPRGEVTLVGPGNKLVSKGIINENSAVILPQLYRRFNIPLKKVSTGTSLGKYKLNVDFRFDGYAQFRGYQASFWQVPLWLPGAAGVIIILAVLWLASRKIRVRRTAKK